jgi:hypothetical protein
VQDDVEDLAAFPVIYDYFWLIHYDAVPKKPQRIVDCKRSEEIHMQSCSRTAQGFEIEENS